MNTKLQKALKIILYALLVLAIIGLGISTYFNTSGVNEWFNQYVSPYLGGATIGVASSALIQFVISFSEKNNMNLIGKEFLRGGSVYEKCTTETKEAIDKMTATYEANMKEAEELKNTYKENIAKLEIAIQKVNTMLNIIEDVASNSKDLIANGTAKRVSDQVAEVKNLEVKQDETNESQGQ